MADNFGLKTGVKCEREFKKALSDINQSSKSLALKCSWSLANSYNYQDAL